MGRKAPQITGICPHKECARCRAMSLGPQKQLLLRLLQVLRPSSTVDGVTHQNSIRRCARRIISFCGTEIDYSAKARQKIYDSRNLLIGFGVCAFTMAVAV